MALLERDSIHIDSIHPYGMYPHLIHRATWNAFRSYVVVIDRHRIHPDVMRVESSNPNGMHQDEMYRNGV